MKKAFVSMVAALAVVTLFGCTKGYETKKTVGDLTIALNAPAYPLVKGDNSMAVKVTDALGKVIADAKVDVRYYMPPMPGMAPMEYTTQATPKGDAYSFNANIPMEGGWKVDVSVARADKTPDTVVFNVDAR